MAIDPSAYDTNDYYADDAKGSRLTPCLDWLLYGLDYLKTFILLSKVVRLAPNATKCVLDVGAGDGKFLFFARKMGWAVRGTTASMRSKIVAAKRFAVDIEYTTDLPDVADGGLITYWHVFEHLEAPEQHANKWRKMLGADGLLMIEVPNIDSVGSKICFRSWLGSDLKHHVNLMSRADIVKMIDKFGLKILLEEHFSLKFSYVFLWSAWLGRLFGSAYHFDSVFDVIKRPAASIQMRPVLTANAVLAVVYLSPIILLSMAWGLLRGRGEVLRMYLQARA